MSRRKAPAAPRIPQACERCGTTRGSFGGEFSYSVSLAAWVCLNCYDRAAAAEATPDPPPSNEDREPTFSSSSPTSSSLPTTSSSSSSPTSSAPASAPASNEVVEKEAEEEESLAAGPEMRWLLEEHRAGRIPDVPTVRLGPMPPDPSPEMRAIADDMAFRLGLQLVVNEDRPLPYAVEEAVRAGIVRHPMQASRAIKRLLATGVIEFAGELPRLPGRRYGTRLYRAPSKVALEGEPVAIEGRAEDVPREPVEPEPHVVDEPLVAGAELAVVDRPGGAVGDGADGHVPDRTPDQGGIV